MVLSIIWFLFFLIALIVALVRFFVFHETDIFKLLVDGMFDSAKTTILDIAFPLAGTMVFFLGILKIAEKAGIINKVAQWINPFMKRLFPEVPDNHPAMGQMVLNFSANLMGLDNAATPFGLSAMQSLQEINPKKDTASNAQLMFLVLHTSGLTIIPLSIITYRIALHSNNANSIFVPCILATLCTTLASIIIMSIWQKIKWDRLLFVTIIGAVGLIVSFLFLYSYLDDAGKNLISNTFASLCLLIFIVSILGVGLYKRVNIFDSFIEGGKKGFEIIFTIIPYLVAMLVSIRMLRDSGTLTYITISIQHAVERLGVNSDFIPAIPVAIMKPFSGAGARGLLIDIMQKYTPDSFVGKLASILQGSSDTTFYIIALYFGSVGIKKIRYAAWAGLLADTIGVICAVIIAYIFWHY